MSLVLTLAYLFFIGSVCGWVLDLVFRNLVHKSEKWINPGFCTGPYVPLYGFGLCVLFLLASLEEFHIIKDPVWNKVFIVVCMAVAMTVIEYIAGIFCLKYLKVRLWDYSKQWGNIQGIICPAFSLAWGALGAVYYFLIHPRILHMLHWLSQNLAFSFFIGMFFGIFIIDVAHSVNLVAKLKSFAEEQKLVVRYEAIKDHVRKRQAKNKMRFHFFRPFHAEKDMKEYLNEMYEVPKHPGNSRRKHRSRNKK